MNLLQCEEVWKKNSKLKHVTHDDLIHDELYDPSAKTFGNIFRITFHIGWCQWSVYKVRSYHVSFSKELWIKGLSEDASIQELKFWNWKFTYYWCWRWKIYTKLPLAKGIHWPVIWSRRDLLLYIIAGDFRWTRERFNFKCFEWISMTFAKFRCDWGNHCMLRWNEL